ncbi:hypothetical protein [Nitrobacter sp.]|uniref:hypothetical protein n=1 Tax=Nitrobacter sp. TaxID=29420 RepID=UPI0029CAB67F|nr:hypothetical protein [Nitrobacter sp.]
MRFEMYAHKSARRRNTWNEARRHALPRPYVARLSAAGGGIAREFIRLTTRSSTGNLEWWSVPMAPGDAIEARTSVWDETSHRYLTGTAWLIHDHSAVQVVDRETAFAFVLSGGRLTGPNDGNLPALPPAAQRMLPAGMLIEETPLPELPDPKREIVDVTEA